jgi:hypothetical protein
MALVVVLAGSWLTYRTLSDPGCTGQVRLAVAAANEIVPAVRQAAQQWTSAGAEVAGQCVQVDVTPVNPAAMASAIGKKHGVVLTGLGQGSGSIVVPDVWIADSTTWLQRLGAEAPGFQPRDGRSIAQSPVVVAMPQPAAQQLGWPDRELSWTDLLSKVNSENSLRTGIVDPTRDAAGLAGLLALGSSAGTGAQAQAAKAGALRALAAGSSALREDLLEKFPRSSDPSEIASSLGAAPMSEEDVIGYNGDKPPVQLAALYLKPTPSALDYPYAVLPEADPLKAAAAEGLHAAMNSPVFKNSLAAAGLRAADGTAGTGFQAPLGAPQPEAVAPTASAPAGGASNGSAAAGAVDPASISQALGSWAAITLPGRALAVFDISGSMLKPVPTAGNLTRAEVTKRAATQGLALFDDDWAVGVWKFSTELRGNQDWQEVEPISPLTARRAELAQSLNTLVPKPNGATGLFDTALAAYKNVQESYQAGRVNSVILFTDGKNEDDNGLSRAQLVNELKRVFDPKRPVRMIIIGIGTEVDRQELAAIAAAVGGGVFVAEDPAKIGEIFLQAISSRADAPR